MVVKWKYLEIWRRVGCVGQWRKSSSGSLVYYLLFNVTELVLNAQVFHQT